MPGCRVENGSLNMSRWCTQLRRCFNYTTRFTLRHYGKDGSERPPVVKAIREVMEGMKFEGEPLWIMVTRVQGGKVGAFFSKVCDDVVARVRAMARDPAVQIYWSLYKRDVFVEDIREILKNAFETDQIVKIDRSRLSKTQRMAVVDTPSGIDMETMFKNTRLIDFTKGLTLDEKRNREIEKGIKFGE